MIENFEDAVKKLLKKRAITWEGTVKSVDGNTCEVMREGLPLLEDVRIDAVSGQKNNYCSIVPKVGSTVLVLEVENEPKETCIVKVTEVEILKVKIGDTLMAIDNNGYKIGREGVDVKTLLTDLTNIVAGIVVVQGKGPDIVKLQTLVQDINKVLV